jgi:hypothetical protein
VRRRGAIGADSNARPVAEVKAFLEDLDNLARWDRSVVKVFRSTRGPLAIGSEFSTLGPAPRGRRGKVTVYRVADVADDGATVDLLHDRVFERAAWTTRLVPTRTGIETDVRCQVSASVRPRYFFVAWVLRAFRRAIADDLYYLKRTIEHGEIAKR